MNLYTVIIRHSTVTLDILASGDTIAQGYQRAKKIIATNPDYFGFTIVRITL